ncbi:MAG TPA: AMP-binding protein [Ramlibacter sp.]|nr:AMP-binding protein [Ramlibacter sp.]
MTADLWFLGERMPAADVEHAIACTRAALARSGIGPGDAVGVMLRNEPRFLMAVRAIRDLGALAVPVNWHWQAAEVAHVADDAPLKLLLVHGDLHAAIGAGLPHRLPVVRVGAGDEWERWRGEEPLHQLAPAPGSTMVYTSGTTGQPKGVCRPALSAEQARRVREVNRLVFGIEPGCRALVVTPLYHSAPGVFGHAALEAAQRLVIEPRFDAERTLALVEEHRITHLYLVPTLMHRLLKLDAATRDRYDLSSLRFVLHGAAPCPPQVKRRLIEWWGPVLHEFYGASEAGPIAAIGSAEWLRRPGSVGRLVPHARLLVADDAGNPVPPGTPGTLYVSQDAYPAFTYRGRPDLRRACEHPQDPTLFTLGDVGWIDGEGFLYLSDRRRDMVISGGVNIYPAEIEAVLCTYEGVRDCAVLGVPDEEFGESLLALVEPEPQRQLSPAAIQGWLRERIAGYKVPRRIEFAASLPREESGKIFKRKLRERYWEGAGRAI